MIVLCVPYAACWHSHNGCNFEIWRRDFYLEVYGGSIIKYMIMKNIHYIIYAVFDVEWRTITGNQCGCYLTTRYEYFKSAVYCERIKLYTLAVCKSTSELPVMFCRSIQDKMHTVYFLRNGKQGAFRMASHMSLFVTTKEGNRPETLW